MRIVIELLEEKDGGRKKWGKLASVGGLAVKVVVVILLESGGASAGLSTTGARLAARSAAAGLVGKAKLAAKAARLLQRLRKHLVLANVAVAHGPARILHSLLKVVLANLRHRVALVHHGVGVVGAALLVADFRLDGLADAHFAGALADFRQVGPAESVRHLGQVCYVHVLKSKGKRRKET